MANNKCIQINRIEEKSYQVDTFDDQLTIYGKFNTYSGIIKGCSGLTSVVWNAKKCNDFTYKSPFPTTVENITFGDEVEYIPARLCCYITCLTSVTIPNSVTSIGSSAFSECSNLTSVTNLSLQPQPIKSNTFFEYGKLHVLQGCKDIYGKAEYWRNFTIEEDAVEPKPQCAIPTIEIINGNVKLSCDTKGTKFNYTYSCSASGTDSEFSINSPTFTIVASANADGYEESDMAIKTFRHNGNGDVNGDGKVTMEDVNIILNTYLGK